MIEFRPCPPLAQSPVALEDGHAHLWSVALDVEDAEAERLTDALAEDERTRASRIAVPVARRRFVVARGALREILARYVGLTPGEVAFRYGTWGKPRLVDPPPVRFSVGHTHDLAVVAVHRDVEIGVDVERVRLVGNGLNLAKRYFAPAEHAALAALGPDARNRAFLRLWTGKEACSKVFGRPLVPMLGRIAFEIRATGPSRLLSIDGDRTAATGWSVVEFEPSHGYLGALAVPGPLSGLAAWRR